MIEFSPAGNDPGNRTGPARNSAVPEIGSDSADRHSPGEFVVLFERFFESFRRQMLECYGDRCEKMVARAEAIVAGRSPRFSLGAMSPDTALSALDLAETITNEASVFKRRKLRRAAIAAVSDLYNTHYETLERFRAIDAVEQFYYRLKK